MINIEDFDSNLVKIDKKSFKNVDIYYIWHIKIKKMIIMKNIYSVNPFYLIIGRLIHWRKNESKNVVFYSTDEKEEVLTKCTELWDGIKKENETITVVKKANMVKISWELNFTQMMICHWIHH